MSILCGTDFSKRSEAAVKAAWALSRRRREPLHLVHVLDASMRELDAAGQHAVKASAREKLREIISALRPAADGQAELHLCIGHVDEELARKAADLKSTLIVVSSLGHRLEPRVKLGGTSERLAMQATVPTLVLRDADAFVAWAEQDSPLRITAAIDDTKASDAVLACLRTMSHAGPLDVTLGHVYYGDELEKRFGHRPATADEAPRGLEQAMRHDLLRRAGGLHDGTMRVELRRGMGRAGSHVLELAEAHNADVVAVGTHHASGPSRALSVSSVVLHEARMAVLVVPPEAQKNLSEPPVPKVDRVLAAIDFGPGSDEVVAWAYGLLTERKGTVHLLHVVQSAPNGDPMAYAIAELQQMNLPRDEADVKLERHARSLLPAAAVRHAVESSVHIVRADNVARTVSELAERLAVDVICVGSRKVHGLTKLVLGSSAEDILRATHRPVFVVWQRSR